MKPERDQLITLALRQATRRERPYNVIKFIIMLGILTTLAGMLGNCAASVPPPDVQKKSMDNLWAGDAAAHERKIP